MIRRLLRYLPIILFCGSLPVPAVGIGDSDTIGVGALIYGWTCLKSPVGWPWLANPLFVFTLFLFFHRKSIWRRTAVYTSGAALLLALGFLLVHKMPGEKADPMVWTLTREVGYWVWLGSMAALVVAAMLNYSDKPANLRGNTNQKPG